MIYGLSFDGRKLSIINWVFLNDNVSPFSLSRHTETAQKSQKILKYTFNKKLIEYLIEYFPLQEYMAFKELINTLLTLHWPPPFRCFHHFSLSMCNLPPSCNCKMALLMGVLYGESVKKISEYIIYSRYPKSKYHKVNNFNGRLNEFLGHSMVRDIFKTSYRICFVRFIVWYQFTIYNIWKTEYRIKNETEMRNSLTKHAFLALSRS